MLQVSRNHFQNIYFIFFSVIFLAHQVLEKILHIPNRWMDSYLDPLLFMPILLHFILWEKWVLFKRPISKKLSAIEVLIWWIAGSIITEYLFPKMSQGFTSDFLDVICYAAGSLFFFFMMNNSEVNILSLLKRKKKQKLFIHT